jgi:hypothetical protein
MSPGHAIIFVESIFVLSQALVFVEMILFVPVVHTSTLIVWTGGGGHLNCHTRP